MTTQTEKFMQKAIDLARNGLGRTAPNPPVGAVLVRNNQVVGEGFHPAAGQPHAEIFALRDAGALMGVRVLDHIIIGSGRYISLADRGLID